MATKFQISLEGILDTKTSTTNIQKSIKEMEKALSIDIPIKADSATANQIKDAISGIGSAAENAKQHTQGLSDIVSKFSSWQIVGDIIHGTKDAMQDMVQQVFDLDASLVEFNKVTDVTPEQLKEITNQAYELGEQLARAGKEAIDAATEFSKAGYKDNAMELAETALLYQNIADEQISTSKATDLIVSQMKAFNVEAEDSIKIIDQINKVSNNFSVSSGDLATAIPKVSATMAQAGNSMSETLALVTARHGNNDWSSF